MGSFATLILSDMGITRESMASQLLIALASCLLSSVSAPAWAEERDAQKEAYFDSIKCKNGKPSNDRDAHRPDSVPGTLPFAYDPKRADYTDDIKELKKHDTRPDAYRFTKQYLCATTEHRVQIDKRMELERKRVEAINESKKKQ